MRGGSSVARRLLVTVLGIESRQTKYSLGDRVVQADLATAALVQLLPDDQKPDEVIALCTPQAIERTWPALKTSLGLRCPAQCVEISLGHEPEDINEFLRAMIEAVPHGPDVHLILDLTHGFRHLPMLMYTAALYLSALQGVKLDGVYYGMLGREDPAPFIDLRPLLELPSWFHAVRVLKRTGSGRPIADLLCTRGRRQHADTLARQLRAASEAYLAGLPLELGRTAQRLVDGCGCELVRTLRKEHRLPLADQLHGQIVDWLMPFKFESDMGKQGWKRGVELNREELERQARLVDDLLERGHIPAALGLMNEWLVSWLLWRRGETDDWLDYRKTRLPAGRRLTALEAVAHDPDLKDTLSPEQRKLGEFRRKLGELRNAYHHHGMRREDLSAAPVADKLKQVCKYWQRVLRAVPQLDVQFGGVGSGSLLVSPIGMRPGVLFSAIRIAEQAAGSPLAGCLVICSSDSAKSIAEAARRAGHPDPQWAKHIPLQDAFGGTGELDDLTRAVRRDLLCVDQVFVNVTGGTTLMGILAERIANEARELGRVVWRFGLIDRRPQAEQEADPYQVGEPLWLDQEPGDGEPND